MVRNVVLLSSDKGIILSTPLHYLRTIRTSSYSKKIPEDRKSTWWPPPRAHALNSSLFVTTTNIVADPPRPPLSTRSCSSKHLPYSWTRAKQNERGCPNRRSEIFFWEERTSKTRQVDLLGLPELKIVTSVNFLGQARSLLQSCGF